MLVNLPPFRSVIDHLVIAPMCLSEQLLEVVLRAGATEQLPVHTYFLLFSLTTLFTW